MSAPSRPSASRHRKLSPRIPQPRFGSDKPAKCIGHRVQIGGYVQPVDLGVIGRVADDEDALGRKHAGQAARENAPPQCRLRARPPSHGSSVSSARGPSPVILHPACFTLCRRFSAMSNAAALSRKRALIERAGIDRAHARNRFGKSRLQRLLLPHRRRRSARRNRRVGRARQSFRAQSVKSRHHRDARGRQSRGLLRGGSVPQSSPCETSGPPMAISSGTVASTRIAPGAKLAANGFKSLDLGGERYRENHDRSFADRIGIGVSGNFARPAPRVAISPRGRLRLVQISRANQHAQAGLRKTQREPASFRSGATHDRDDFFHVCSRNNSCRSSRA